MEKQAQVLAEMGCLTTSHVLDGGYYSGLTSTRAEKNFLKI